jgi:hypothetical protein
MAAAFKFTPDDDILGAALEVQRQKEAEHQKATAEKARLIEEEQGRLHAEEAARQAKAKAEADALAAVEAERLAKERAVEEDRQRLESEKLARERAAEAIRLAKQQAEITAQNKAAAELAEKESAKQQALAAMLAKDAQSKDIKKIPPPLSYAPPPSPANVQPKDAVVPAKPVAKPSPWGGTTLKPAPQPQAAAEKLPNSSVFKALPPPIPEPAVEVPPSVPKRPGLLGAAFGKRPDGSA